jgi:hypothetical protein
VATVVEAVSRIYEATRCRRARPDRRHAVVTVVEAARHAMVAGARLGGGRERGAAAALILIRWLVGWEEVAEHPLHRLHRLEREQPRATPHRHATSIASFRPVGRTREEREIENGQEKTMREEKRILLRDHTWHSTRKHVIRVIFGRLRLVGEQICGSVYFFLAVILVSHYFL